MPTIEYQQYLLDCARYHVEPVPFELWDREAWLHHGLSTFTDISALQAD